MAVTFNNNCADNKYAFLQNLDQSKTNTVQQYEVVKFEQNPNTYYKAFFNSIIEDGKVNTIVSTLHDLKSRILELVCPVILNRQNIEFGLLKVLHSTDSAQDVYCDWEVKGDTATLYNCQTLSQLETHSTDNSPIPPFNMTVSDGALPSEEPTLATTEAPSVTPTLEPTETPSSEPTDSNRIPAAFSNSYVLLGTGIALVACISYIAYKSMMKRTTSDSTKKSTSVLPTIQNLNAPKVSKISPNRIEASKTFSIKRTSFLKV